MEEDVERYDESRRSKSKEAAARGNLCITLYITYLRHEDVELRAQVSLRLTVCRSVVAGPSSTKLSRRRLSDCLVTNHLFHNLNPKSVACHGIRRVAQEQIRQSKVSLREILTSLSLGCQRRLLPENQQSEERHKKKLTIFCSSRDASDLAWCDRLSTTAPNCDSIHTQTSSRGNPVISR